MNRAVTLWLPAALWAAIVFVLSARQFAPGYEPLFAHVDKLQHIGVYAVLGWLVARPLTRVHGLPVRRAATFAIVIASLYAVTDEWHQSLVPTRSADALDWIADTVGAALGQLPLWYESRRSQKTNRQAA
jgi:VanZ family protein